MTRSKRNNTAVSSAVVVRPANARLMTVQPRTRTRSRRARQGTSNNPDYIISPSALHPDVRAYALALSDPFNHPPVRLGFGCMVPSQLTVLTSRAFVSSGPDGMIGAFVIPAVNASATMGCGGLYYTSSPTSVAPTLNALNWQNASAAGSLYEEVRVIACGLRVTPMIPGTSAPGAAFVASIPSTSYNQLAGQPLNNLINNPLFKWGYASSGAQAFGRPIDPDSFNFKHSLLWNLPGADDAPFTIPYVIMNGLPPNYTILVEAVLQVEGIYGVSPQAATQLSANTVGNETGLNRFFSSVETMWSVVKRVIPSATTVQSAFNLANSLLNLTNGSQSSNRPRVTRYLPSSVQGQLLP